MSHPLVYQLRFARAEFKRGLGDVVGPAAQQRFEPMNCISWMVGHLAWQEQRYWLQRAQGQILLPELNQLLAYGKPGSTPPVEEMWAAWQQVTQAANPWLEQLTTDHLRSPILQGFSSIGTFMLRTIYHYWYHLGEGMAVRQLLGHADLPDFVGDIDHQAPFRTEQGEPLDEQMNKDRLIQLVIESRRQWDDLASRVKDERMLEPGSSGNWTLKDVIAHLTWHEREMLGVLRERALVGSDLWQLPLDERNQVIYEQLRDLPLEQVKRESKQVSQELIQELEKLAEEDLVDPVASVKCQQNGYPGGYWQRTPTSITRTIWHPSKSGWDNLYRNKLTTGLVPSHRH
jgi:uncharacterized damage-inducible protein DinB